MTAFLEVTDLHVSFSTDDGAVSAVNGVEFALDRGSTLGIVGESGSGKSVTSMAIMGLHDPRSTTLKGSIRLDGKELNGLSEPRYRKLRGPTMAMIFQDPLSALHPYFTVGSQISTALRAHRRMTKRAARDEVVSMLDRVGIPNPHSRFDEYPHQFSGGMRQRAMIALALISQPELLIADEPTTALDVTVQAQILELLQDLQADMGMSILFITHDLGVVANICDDVLVMYGGQTMEKGTAQEIFHDPRHPYTRGLLQSMPRIDQRDEKLYAIPGVPPSLLDLPGGCPFAGRCDIAAGLGPTGLDRCRTQRPAPQIVAGRELRCHARSFDSPEVIASTTAVKESI